MSRIVLLVIVLKSLFIGFAQAQTTVQRETLTVGAVSFSIPPASEGWASAILNDGATLTKDFPVIDGKRESPGKALITISEPSAPSGSLVDAVNAYVKSNNIMKTDDGALNTTTGVRANGDAISMVQYCCRALKDITAQQFVAGVDSPDGRRFLALYLFNYGDDDDAAERDFFTILRTMRASGAPVEDTNLKPQSDDGGLSGMFTHLSTSLMPNVFGGIDMNVNNELLIFDDSGLFSEEVPVGGTIQSHCAMKPGDCGTYSVSKGLLGGFKSITMRRGVSDAGIFEVKTTPLASAEGGLEVDGNTYSEIKKFRDGTALEGSWRYLFAQSGTMGGNSGGVVVERFLRFTADGRYESGGFSGFNSSTENGDGRTSVSSGSDASAKRGTYALSGYELTLTPDAGPVLHLTAFAPDKDSTEVLVINGENDLKQK